MVLGRNFDVAIVGAGVVGAAVFREAVLSGLSAVLIERGPDILEGASKANSAILHTGFDCKPATLEHTLVQQGHARYCSVHQRLGLPLLRVGATLVAWNNDDLASLDTIARTASRNGVPLTRLDRAALVAREPNLGPSALGALVVENESVIDPWSAPLAYVSQAVANGGVLLRSTAVTDARFADGSWTIGTNPSTIRARVVINCAGLQGDLVEAIARPSPFTIRPRKGQFIVYDKSAHGLVSSIILPVPTPVTKGVVITRTAFGNLLLGPTAEPQDDRDNATLTQGELQALIRAGEKILPDLAHHDITAAYAGLRPATEHADYQIEALAARHWITVGGIRSTGLTAALGISAHVMALYEDTFGPLRPLPDPLWPTVPNLTQALPRSASRPGRSPIVCHCEAVTQSDIAAALDDPLVPAGSIGGLRRRTRCMMGRCQGFYCTRRVVELACGRLPGLEAASHDA
ncbi:FAD-dependent oxidoreductase [Ameyamaea chiangmaiensis]|nr:FAD-dependent oxidoreductase [Ameyamaea chiangmaiensis]